MFKVYKQQISSEIIDSILKDHNNFKHSNLSFFRAQGTDSFEKPMIDEFGNQVNSIHNPHLLGFNYNFSQNIKKAILSNNLSKCLSDFTGSDKHIWYQSMFFDKSTGTKLHQDTWYLDTIPNGKLVGVWIALEDIDMSSGPFCIYTNTDTKKLDSSLYSFDYRDNSDIDKEVNSIFPDAQRYDFTAKKGDILIWDSFSVHGALMPTDDSKTRKSITCHFYPASLEIQDAPVKRFYSIYNHKKPIKTFNLNINQATVINPVLYQSLCLLIYQLEKFKKFKNLIFKEMDNKKLSQIRRIKK